MQNTETPNVLQFEEIPTRKYLTHKFNEIFDSVEYRGINLRNEGWQWRFGNDKKMKILGQAQHDDKMIVMCIWCFDEGCCSIEEAKDTFLHEMAHAFDCEIRGKSDHTKPWKDICIRIGAKPEKLKKVDPPNKAFKWNAKCDECGEIFYKSNTKKYAKKGEKFVHKKCRDKMLENGVDLKDVIEILSVEWIKNF